MKIIKSYACDICKAIYPKAKLAEECEAQGLPKKLLQIGDIVFRRQGFGWYDGDAKWILNPKVLLKPRPRQCPVTHDFNCFDSCCLYNFYFVVTHIDENGHRRKYHLATKAMTKKSGWDQGYTYYDGVSPFLVKKPSQYIIKTSKYLLGNKTDRLL